MLVLLCRLLCRETFSAFLETPASMDHWNANPGPTWLYASHEEPWGAPNLTRTPWSAVRAGTTSFAVQHSTRLSKILHGTKVAQATAVSSVLAPQLNYKWW